MIFGVIKMAYKIIYLFPDLKRSGPTNQLFNLIKFIDRSIYVPYIVTLSSEGNDSRWDDFESLGCKMECLDISGIKSVTLDTRKMKAVVNKIRPDIIHSQGFRCDIISSKILVKEYPVLTTVRGIIQDGYPMQYGRIKGAIYCMLHAHGIRRMGKIVGVSKAVTHNLVNRYGSLVCTILNGVDTELYQPAPSDEEKSIIRRKLGIPSERRVFVTVGHLTEGKNPDKIINAFRALFMAQDYLVVVGSGPLQGKCQKAMGNSKNVKLAGRVSNVNEYLKASDYYISASRSEGMPNSVLEAMACGLPCILSLISSHEEIINMNRKSGALFSLNDADGLEKCLRMMCDRQYDDMKNNTLDTVNSNLSAAIMADRYQALYKEMIENN